MSRFLLDTDTCIFFLHRQFKVKERIEKEGVEKCRISEITLAELRFGAERSRCPSDEHHAVDLLAKKFNTLPITQAIRIYAAEKARLWSIGQKLDEFDLLIGQVSATVGTVS